MNRRKYPEVTGWWVYVMCTPNNMYYVGYGGGKNGTEQVSRRWQPLHYKDISLEPYIKEYGWNNLEKVVLKDGLTKDGALQFEDTLIKMYKQLGCCINKQRSGNISNNHTLYMAQYRRNLKDNN